MKSRKERAGVGDSLALQHFGHQRCRRGRDRAAAALEADIRNTVAVEGHVNRDSVAAQWIVALRKMRRLLHHAEITRMPPMIEDDVLVKLAQIHHRENISRHASTAAARWSISSLSL